MAEIMVLDEDRYGFVMLKYYELSSGFAEDETYTDSENEKVFDSLPEEKQSELIGRKADFAKAVGICL